MARTYHGVVRDRVVILPEGAEIADGTEVEVRVVERPEAETEQLTPGSRIARLLVESGLMREVKPPLRSLPPGDRRPIEVKGEPLSETIIRDRR